MASTPIAADARRPRRMEKPGGLPAALLVRLIWSEARRSHAIWIMPVLVAAGVWFALEYSRVDLLFWDQVSANIALTFVLIGPVCSAWGSWLAGRESRYRLTELMSAGPTSPIRRDVVAFGTPLIGAVGSYALIALVVAGYTATYATWGGPAWSVILFGAAFSAVMTLCGSVFGRIWPSRITPFIAFAVPLLYTTLTYSYYGSWDGMRWVAPYAYIMDWKQRPGNFLYESSASYFRGSLLGGTLVALGIVLLAIALLAGARRRLPLAGIAIGLAMALFVSAQVQTGTQNPEYLLGMFASPQEVMSSPAGPLPVVDPPLSCGGDIVTTCLHQVYEPELEDVAKRVDSMFAPIAGLPGVPERIEQRADLESTDSVLRFDQVWTYEVLPPGSAAYDLLWPVLAPGPDIDEGGKLTAPQHVIARWLTMKAGDFYHAGAAAEIENPYEQASEQRRLGDGTTIVEVPEDERMAYQKALDHYNQQVSESADRFAALSPEEQRSWLEANWDALRAGELTLEDLP